MLLQGLAGDEVVVEVGEDEWEVAKKLVHEAALERPKGMKRYSKSPKGVTIAVLGMFSAAIGI